MRGVQLALAAAAMLSASISPYEQIAEIREHIKPRQKRADPAKKAARKRQRKARAISRKS